MTYRGTVSNGVVVLEGRAPPEGTLVNVTPVESAPSPGGRPADHPAVGVWSDRSDLPEDAAEASTVLRERMMRRADVIDRFV